MHPSTSATETAGNRIVLPPAHHSVSAPIEVTAAATAAAPAVQRVKASLPTTTQSALLLLHLILLGLLLVLKKQVLVIGAALHIVLAATYPSAH